MYTLVKEYRTAPLSFSVNLIQATGKISYDIFRTCIFISFVSMFHRHTIGRNFANVYTRFWKGQKITALRLTNLEIEI